MLKTLSALSALILLAGGARAEKPRADLLLVNAHIYTPGGWAEALAAKDGVILAVGKRADEEALKADGARVIDLGGKTVLPGFIDMHAHAAAAGLEELGCHLPRGAATKIVFQTIRGCVAKAPKGAWVAVARYDPLQFPDHDRMRAQLDMVSPDNPVVIRSADAHAVWANSLAMKAAGITRDTPDPQSGKIVRDKTGEPTGVFSESPAYALIQKVVPRPGLDERIAALGYSSRKLASYGITSYTEAAARNDDEAMFAAAVDRGVLLQRTRLCNVWSPPHGSQPEGGVDAIRMHNLYARPTLDTACVKIFADGTPGATHTGAMLDPYLPHDGKTDDRGFLQMPQQVMSDALTRFDAAGYSIKIHACGDAAVREALNGYEAARRTNGYTRPQEIAHWCFAKPDDILRARALGVTVEISNYIWDPADPMFDDTERVVGPERMAHFYPARTAIESGANVTLGSDWATSASPNPWPAIESLVTRRHAGDAKGRIVAGDERITLAQAIDMITVAGARQLGQEAKIGRLAPGLLADFIVLDRDPFAVPVTDIGKTRVLETVIGGKTVYQRPEL